MVDATYTTYRCSAVRSVFTDDCNDFHGFLFAVLPDGSTAQLDRATAKGAVLWLLVRPQCAAIVPGRLRGAPGTVGRKPGRLRTDTALPEVSVDFRLL